jgi:hypothetical protein
MIYLNIDKIKLFVFKCFFESPIVDSEYNLRLDPEPRTLLVPFNHCICVRKQFSQDRVLPFSNHTKK